MSGTSFPRLCYRGSLLPDPRYDAVRAIILAVMDDVEECPDGLYTARIMLFDDSGKPPKDAMNHVQASCVMQHYAFATHQPVCPNFCSCTCVSIHIQYDRHVPCCHLHATLQRECCAAIASHVKIAGKNCM